MNATYTKTVDGKVVERRELRLGDKIERVLNKITGVKKLPCHDKQTGNLKPESPCGRAKARLNAGEPIISTIIKRVRGE